MGAGKLCTRGDSVGTHGGKKISLLLRYYSCSSVATVHLIDRCGWSLRSRVPSSYCGLCSLRRGCWPRELAKYKRIQSGRVVVVLSIHRMKQTHVLVSPFSGNRVEERRKHDPGSSGKDKGQPPLPIGRYSTGATTVATVARILLQTRIELPDLHCFVLLTGYLVGLFGGHIMGLSPSYCTLCLERQRILWTRLARAICYLGGAC